MATLQTLVTITNFKNQILESGLNLGDDMKNIIGIRGNIDNGAIKNLIPDLGLNLGNEANERNGTLSTMNVGSFSNCLNIEGMATDMTDFLDNINDGSLPNHVLSCGFDR